MNVAQQHCVSMMRLGLLLVVTAAATISSQTVAAANLSSTPTEVIVPCRMQSDHYTIANGTIFLLQNCTNENGTILTLWPNATLLSDLTIVIEHSRRIAVQIQGADEQVDLMGLHMTVNNVTNNDDPSNTTTSTNTSDASCLEIASYACLPLIRVARLRSLMNSTIVLNRVSQELNQSMLVIGGNVSIVAGLALNVTNSLMTSTDASMIALLSVSRCSHISVVIATAIIVASPTMDGAVSSDLVSVVVLVSACNVFHSTLDVTDVATTSGEISMALQMAATSADGLRFTLANSLQINALQMSFGQLDNSEIHVYNVTNNAGSVAAAEATTAPLIQILSPSAVSKSTVSLTRITYSGSAAVSVFRLLYVATDVSTFALVLKDVHVSASENMTEIARIDNVTGSVSNCSLTAESITYFIAANRAVAITGVFFFVRLPMIEGTIVSVENVTLQGTVNPTPQVAAIYLGAESSCRSCRIQIGNIRFLQISALSFALLVDNSSIEHFFNCHHC